MEISLNWVLADRHGNIGYQMSGLSPIRPEGYSGLLPIPAWESENDEKTFVSHEDLSWAYNPDSGFFITANNNLNSYGKVKPINICMAEYRAERIETLLTSAETPFTTEMMGAIQYDVHSTQAERFMEIINPLLPETPAGKILKNWDYKYNPSSAGAFLFEQIYSQLFNEVLGKKLWVNPYPVT